MVILGLEAQGGSSWGLRHRVGHPGARGRGWVSLGHGSTGWVILGLEAQGGPRR